MTYAHLHSIITQNASHFSLGNTLTEHQLLAMFSMPVHTSFTSYKNAQKYMFSKLTLYTKLNKILHKRGLHLCSKDYYSEFYITSKVGSSIKAYDKQARSKIRSAVKLREGQIQHHSVWSPLTTSELYELH